MEVKSFLAPDIIYRLKNILPSSNATSSTNDGKERFLYAALFIVALIIFTIINFDTKPLEATIKKFAYEKAGVTLKIDKTGFAFPVGLTFDNLQADVGQAAISGKVDYLKIRLLLLSLLTGNPALRLYAEQGDGELTIDAGGKFAKDGKLEIDIESRRFPIHEAFIPANGKLPVDLFLTADGNFSIADGDMQKLEGELVVSLFDVKLDWLFPSGNLGEMIAPKKVTCKVTVQKRKLETDECFAETKLGKVTLKVTAMLSKKVEKTALRGFIIISKPTGILKTVLSVNPKLRRADNSYHIPLKGTFERPLLAL